MCELKKKLAFGIAGVSAALIAGWRIVQSESETGFSGPGDEPAPDTPPNGDPVHDRTPVGSAAATNGGPGSVAESRSREPESPAGMRSGPATRRSLAEADDADVPDEASKAELYEIAQGLKIKGRSKMSKTELRRAIEAEG
ncbi:MAG: hypothetical protein KDB62_07405 [Solirubrobacterales bacterium]|nr:hypothetical protein [Solirubrobacterales bacterium]